MLSSSSSPILQIPPNSPSAVPRRYNLRPLAVSGSAAANNYRPNLSFASPKPAAGNSLYDVLGVPMGASNQEIKLAYRRLAKTRHPDAVAVDRKDSAASDFMKIHEAYETLSDPETRAAYDGKLIGWNRPVRVGLSGNGRRNWETDQCW